MPYIKQEDRDRFDSIFAGLRETLPRGPGELNFLLSSILNLYCQKESLNYAKVNEVVGVIEAVKLEFYRRVAAPYEDNKIIENGDVYS